MALSNDQKLQIMWNKLMGGKATTGPDYSFDEESIKSRPNNRFDNIWVDTIPDDNPLYDHQAYGDGIEYPTGDDKIIKKYHKVVLSPVRGNSKNVAFRNADLFDVIPSEFGNGKYQWELWKKDTDGNYTVKIAFGLKGWFFDGDSGILYFPSGFPDGINNTNLLPAITCYKYVGRKGSAELLGTGNSVDGNNVQVDDESIQLVGGQLSIKGKYKTVGYSANTLSSNANLSSNTFTINHNLGTMFVTTTIFENSNLKRKAYFEEVLVNNNSIKVNCTSNVRAGDFQITIIGLKS